MRVIVIVVIVKGENKVNKSYFIVLVLIVKMAESSGIQVELYEF